jgi:pimeloyl-ACP methyl ester carboxylesterase
MERSFTLALIFTPIVLWAQFPVGQRNLTFNDPARDGRAIPCEVYYPAVSSGSGTEAAEGSFPVLAFGHGFAMGVGAYANITAAFVPAGYIVVLPTTEGSLLPAPSHSNFGLDLAFVVGAMQAEGLDNASPFFGHVALTSAVMGHSMGGGASFLAAASNADITTLVTYAPAETNPSAIAAAAQVDIPALIFAGNQDCVTPPSTNQIPMYEALPGNCKAYVEITGGGHCNFANSNFNCSFGELTCGGGGSLGRAGQQALADQYTLLWLDRYLKDDAAAGDAFEALVQAGSGITAQWELSDCPPLASTSLNPVSAPDRQGHIAPIPLQDRSELRFEGYVTGARFQLIDPVGRVVRDEALLGNVHPIERGALRSGTYVWRVSLDGTAIGRGRLLVE